MVDDVTLDRWYQEAITLKQEKSDADDGGQKDFLEFFKPDYAKYFAQDDLSVSDFCLLLIGVCPEHIDITTAENGTLSFEVTGVAKEYYAGFERYLRNTLNIYPDALRENYQIAVSCLKAHNFQKPYYKGFIEFNYPLSKPIKQYFLSKAINCKSPFVAEYETYDFALKGDDLATMKDIKADRETAIATLLGVKPEYFKRYLEIDQEAFEKSLKVHDKSKYYYDLSADKKCFYNVYEAFLSSHLQISDSDLHFFQGSFLNAALKSDLEGSTIEDIARELYDLGYIFKEDILRQLGIVNLEFRENGQIYQFYKYWCGRQGITVNQAAKLLIGETPEEDFISGRGIKSNIHIRALDTDLFIQSEAKECTATSQVFLHVMSQYNVIHYHDYHGKIINLCTELAIAEAMGDITAYEVTFQSKGKEEKRTVYKPKEIIKWLYEKTVIAPPKPLITMLFGGDTIEGDMLEEIEARAEDAKERKQQLSQKNLQAKDFSNVLTEVAPYIYAILAHKKTTVTKPEIVQYFSSRLPSLGFKPLLSFGSETLALQIQTDAPDLRSEGRGIKLSINELEQKVDDVILDNKSKFSNSQNSTI